MGKIGKNCLPYLRILLGQMQKQAALPMNQAGPNFYTGKLFNESVLS